MQNEFDSLYSRLRATRERQAAILAQTDKEIAALDRITGRDKQVDLVDVSTGEVSAKRK